MRQAQLHSCIAVTHVYSNTTEIRSSAQRTESNTSRLVELSVKCH